LDELRYVIALALLLVMPGVYLYWFLVHPWVHLWRRIGVPRTLVIIYTPIVLAATALWLVRKPLLAVEWGTDWRLIAAATPFFALAAWLRRQLAGKLTFTTLIGIPELDPNRRPARLLTDGIYARLRHPRYVQILVALAGYALVANYLAAYVIAGVGLVWLWLVVRIEERELRERFGAEWEAYAARVPRFLPRW
jgi:protein-S-isoprenylcysteine O-methyltransferase Ste14